MTPCRSNILIPDACALYRPGHKAHPVQVGKGTNDTEAWVDALAFLRPDGIIRLHVWENGDRVELWHHESLTGFVADGSLVQWAQRWRLLRAGRRLLCVASIGG